jgi:hypothetical protein
MSVCVVSGRSKMLNISLELHAFGQRRANDMALWSMSFGTDKQPTLEL